jgi:hypothetical protein
LRSQNFIKNNRLAAFVLEAAESFSEKKSIGLWMRKYGTCAKLRARQHIKAKVGLGAMEE